MNAVCVSQSLHLFQFAGPSRVTVDVLEYPYKLLCVSNVHVCLSGNHSAILQTHAATDAQGLPLRRLDADVGIRPHPNIPQSLPLIVLQFFFGKGEKRPGDQRLPPLEFSYSASPEEAVCQIVSNPHQCHMRNTEVEFDVDLDLVSVQLLSFAP